ncbi:arsenical-resistance protein [Batrachochytrium salamandrivorans]|nr:hypothetical protein BASA62_004533 [Batrachochytrium salamandrivorans]KAH9271999.1 arsenical-resistance protein [Batrachochytrium salamandrivorans]KAJ1332409.1 arsenical-resistance protein [Batrachochytrium salamandrivorans]
MKNDTIAIVPSQDETAAAPAKLDVFQKFLSLWAMVAMAVGILVGYFLPAIPEWLDKATVAQVSIPIAILLWGMILPMMLQIDFGAVANVFMQPKAIVLTSLVNFAVQPFTMYGLSLLFFKVIFGSFLGPEKAGSYVVGTVLLGGAPCTAMVLVWSTLMNGNAAYTLAQVAVNDLILLVTYSPTVKLLAGSFSIPMPWTILLSSVGGFVLIPLVLGVLIRTVLSHDKAWFSWLNTTLIPILDSCSTVFLLAMVALLFVSQASTIKSNLVDILVIAIPLALQRVLSWAITYSFALWMHLPFDIAGPASLIACSSFFEMAVAISLALYGAKAGSTLATVVGVLIEVPMMLMLVNVNNRTQHLFAKRID